MPESLDPRPRLRPVSVSPIEHEGRPMVLVTDPSRLAAGPVVVSPAALFLLSVMDGRHDLDQIAGAFRLQFGQSLPRTHLESLVRRLDEACYLDNRRFADYYAGLVAEYRAAPARRSPDAASFGAADGDLAALLDGILDGHRPIRPRPDAEPILGLIAPHLDFPRGAPAYAESYGALAAARPAERFVILGTNHAGRGRSVVATGKDFETPLGRTRTDRAFLAAVERACEADLCADEFDHQREHSIELQVLVLQHLLGPGSFEIVPFLCHDPCGPGGTAPADGRGVDLRVFAEHLGRLVRRDNKRTVIIAGADFSHVGRWFGDDRDLDEAFLAEVEQHDRRALAAVVDNDPDRFADILRSTGNHTRVCSAGAVYALLAALPEARPELRVYHQAADPESGNGVTCASVVLHAPDAD